MSALAGGALTLGQARAEAPKTAEASKPVAAETTKEKKPLSEVPKIVLENDRVRVKDVLMKPGETHMMHDHPLSHIGIVLEGGQLQIVDERNGKQTVKVNTMERGGVGFAKAGTRHEGTNVGDTPIRFIIVELK
jgi:quercetin dioxygenase-like cupin family protein